MTDSPEEKPKQSLEPVTPPMVEITETETEDGVEDSVTAIHPESLEEQVQIHEIALKQLAQDVSHDIRALAEQSASHGRIIAGVYSMAMASQVLAESVARYVAGYVPGQFKDDVDKALEADDPEGIKLSAKNDTFDTEKFMALVKESAEAFVRIKEHEAEKRRKEAEAEQSGIVQLPPKKIILP